MELFSFWLGFVVIFYSAGSSVQASFVYKCRPVEIFETPTAAQTIAPVSHTEAAVTSTKVSATTTSTGSTPAQTKTAALGTFFSDLFKDISPLSMDSKLDPELSKKVLKKYEEFYINSFKDIAGKDVDLQGLTSELMKNLLEQWSVYTEQIQGNFFEKAASVATRAKMIGVFTKYLYDIASFDNFDYVTFLSDGRFIEIFNLLVEANNLVGDTSQPNILIEKSASLLEKIVAIFVDAVKKSKKT